jgi:3-oxoacyl-[acyl-carrier-protein] synthase II
VTVNQATVAGDLAVARGAALVAAGHAAAVLAGGVDELCAPVYRRLAELGVLSPMSMGGPEGCRPFLPEHNGPVIGEGATFLVLEALDAARARGATIHAEIRGGAWSNIPVAPHTAPRRRRDPGSPVRRLLARLELAPSAIARSYGSGNGDPNLDDWEMSLLAEDLSETPGLSSAPRSLAPLFGQHSGLGVLRAGAAALDCRSGLAGPVLVHGIARGGCRTALMLDRAA